MSHLTVENVSKTYASNTALYPINLALEQGELITLLGPSGCGKTTLLRIVAGFTAPSGGQVRLGGRDLTQLPAARRQMGMVFQAYSLFPNLSAEDNVRFGLKVRGVDKAASQQKLNRLFEMIGLSDMRQRFPHQLSGGQQQRVALARALAIEPQVLLLDEPLSALDAQVRLNLRDEIRRVQRETGTTTLFVTHDQEEALAISDRVAVMQQGRVAQLGTPEDIYCRPATPFVAEFVGTANCLDAVVTDPLRGLITVEGWAAPILVDAARPYPLGQRLKLYLRPEELRLGAEDAPGSLSGEVSDRRFLGSLTRLSVRVGPHILVTDLQGSAAGGFPLGTRVGVSFSPLAAQILAV
ncbi:ABC transporter ATP-binding protein [Deinococcus rubellus]|uniref:ABC transporter ATP-binding protein n=1 Tax=Deinococcus rubellus TaxID=1889240 RepID=A0ABY5YJ45_9DEIO|nr:ABC transporter ATP-binding protein [Deinococcus rubellus]UWX64813.1 ABC transporter ATP-binding protein [Deinococcus rubellus]